MSPNVTTLWYIFILTRSSVYMANIYPRQVLSMVYMPPLILIGPKRVRLFRLRCFHDVLYYDWPIIPIISKILGSM